MLTISKLEIALPTVANQRTTLLILHFPICCVSASVAIFSAESRGFARIIKRETHVGDVCNYSFDQSMAFLTGTFYTASNVRCKVAL